MIYMVKKKKRGRPTSFEESYVRQVHSLCLLGFIDKEIADFFNVAESTINLWKLKHADFSESMKRGKAVADAAVAEALYKKAVGYKCEATHVSIYMGRVVSTKYIKHYPPDVSAAKFWLKHRQPGQWSGKCADVSQNLGLKTAEDNLIEYEKRMQASREMMKKMREERLNLMM